MPNTIYTDEYSADFKSELEEIVKANTKVKGMVAKAIPIILYNPFNDTEEFIIGGELCRRKWIAAKKYRVIFGVDPSKKIVKFFNIRLKSNKTYRLRPSVF